MNYILLISLIVLLIIVFNIFKKSLFSASTFLISGFLLCTLSLISKMQSWNYTISLKTYILIITSIVCFIFGEWIFGKFKSDKRNGLNVYGNKTFFIFDPYKFKGTILLICLFSLLAVVIQLRYFSNLRSAATVTYSGKVITGAMIRSFSVHYGIDRSFFETVIIKLLPPLSYVSFFLFVNTRKHPNNSFVKWFLLLPLLCNLVCELLTTNRIGIIYNFIVVLGILLTCRYFKAKTKSEFNKFFLKVVVVVGLIALVSFRIAGFFTLRGLDRSFVDQIADYSGAAIVALDLGLTGNAEIIMDAPTLFSGFLKYLNLLNITDFNFMNSNAPFISWNNGDTNIYSSIYCYVCSIGYFGNYFTFMVMGLIFGWLKHVMDVKKNVFSILVYSWVLYIPTMSCIADRFYSQVLVGFFFVQLIEIYLLSRYFEKKGKNRSLKRISSLRIESSI